MIDICTVTDNNGVKHMQIAAGYDMKVMQTKFRIQLWHQGKQQHEVTATYSILDRQNKSFTFNLQNIYFSFASY